ncbi:MAG: signal peptidase I [Acidobacteriota bacterium]|nr:signal peptidase I [Acidobacteriota bacterium]
MSLARRLVFGSNPRRTAVRILILTAVSFGTFRWILIPVRTQGISMQPTYESDHLTFVNRLAFVWRPPARGDIVAIRLAGPHVVYVKRIVGLPGERLEIVEGQVLIDALPLAEPYVRNRRPWDVPEVTLEKGEYFVIGDNRGMRVGDHDFGRVDAARILGRILF